MLGERLNILHRAVFKSLRRFTAVLFISFQAPDRTALPHLVEFAVVV